MEGRHRGTRVQARTIQGRIKKWEVFGLRQVQRRDFRVQRCDVPESKVSNVATLRTNIATLQRRPKMQLIQQRSKIRENSPHAIVTLLNLLNRPSLRLSITGPASRHPKKKKKSDYGQKQKTNILKADNNKKI